MSGSGTACPRASVEEVVRTIGRLTGPALVAIDGLPCSGKTTLAERLRRAHGLECVWLDEFVRPEAEWPWPRKPAFPFGFVRYDEFLDAVRTLAATGRCRYAPFDFATLTISRELRSVTLDGTVLVEGVSSLHPDLCRLYNLRLFVDSDRSTTFQAALDRGVGPWATEWRDLFLPSADLYMAGGAIMRADLVVPGRGMSWGSPEQ